MDNEYFRLNRNLSTPTLVITNSSDRSLHKALQIVTIIILSRLQPRYPHVLYNVPFVSHSPHLLVSNT